MLRMLGMAETVGRCCKCLPGGTFDMTSGKDEQHVTPCLQALPGWPHVMSTGTRQTILGRTDSSGSGGSSSSGSHGSGGGSGRLGAAMRAARRRAAGAQVLLTEHVENLWLTGYRCSL